MFCENTNIYFEKGLRNKKPQIEKGNEIANTLHMIFSKLLKIIDDNIHARMTV